MEEYDSKLKRDKDGGNFWSDFNASQSDSDLSYFSNGKSSTQQRADTPLDSNFTPYQQWSTSPFQYSLWGSPTPPTTPGPQSNGSRLNTPMSNFTTSTSRSTTPGSPKDLASTEWHNDTRHYNGNLMVTYDSAAPASVDPWSQQSHDVRSNSCYTYPARYQVPIQRSNSSNYYDARFPYAPYSNQEQRNSCFDPMEKLAEEFKDFKLKPQILNKRISDRKIKANLKKPACQECVFCKNNGELERLYKSHVLKDVYGRVQCPILRHYTCPICGQPGGDKAHTVRYCPQRKSVEKMELDCLKKIGKRSLA